MRAVWRRIQLTYKYRGLGTLVYRAITYPLRFTPWAALLTLESARTTERSSARRWYQRHGRPVTVVIPSYRDADHVRALVRSIRRTTRRRMVSIIVCDDGSGPEHVAALRAIDSIEVVVGEQNAGFAANVNRGLRAAAPEHDVVLLNSDIVARRGWLAGLQYATTRFADVGLVSGKLLYPDGRIQYGGTVRNLGAPEWFDHRFRFAEARHGPANIPATTIAASGACMYITRTAREALGEFDESYPMAYEDVDYSLRAWQAGLRVVYWPAAELVHHESVTRGTEVGARERRSQQIFWERWGAFLDARSVRTESGELRIVYVTEDTGVGGGHRDIFEHLNRLADRGHDVALWTLGPPPEWFELRVPVRTFDEYGDLAEALAPLEAIKVATWWRTAGPVWEASVVHGIPVFFVQDIETSYYPDTEQVRDAVIAAYQPEFRYMTISAWNGERLRELGLEAALVPPGIDLDTFRPRPEVARRAEMVLALGRTNPLKNLPLTLEAWRRLPEPRPELCLFGIEPELGGEAGIRYVEAPSDDEVGRLFSEATVFVQTSIHEGFCLPPLESMASGGAVVCTDAHGNRDFCADGVNCLMPPAEAVAVSDAIAALLHDPERRAGLGEAGMRTAADYAWSRRIDQLERFLDEVAAPRTIAASTDVVPDRRVAPRAELPPR
jgi:GT2 family glycosyltransferase